MKVKIINKSDHPLPNYETLESAGMDLRSNIKTDITLKPNQRAIVLTGIFIALPKGYEAQVRSRSGLAAKYGVTVLNSPGTIDADYRGEIKVILINLNDKVFTVEKGLRIAQMVVCPVIQAQLEEVSELDNTHRGKGGFGSTGIK